MVLVPSQKPYFEVNITTKPFQMPRACDKGAKTEGQHYSKLSAGVKTISNYPGKWERDGSSPQPKTLLSRDEMTTFPLCLG